MKKEDDIKVIKRLFIVILILIVLLMGFSIWFVTNSPKIINTNTQYMQMGEPGLSAYEVAQKQGFVGSEKDWVKSLKGAEGETKVVTENKTSIVEVPANGKSAYDIWIDNGNIGSQQDFINSLSPNVDNVIVDIRLNDVNGKLETRTKSEKFWTEIKICGGLIACK